MSPVVRALLPERMQKTLASLHDAARAETPDLATLSAADAALDGLVAVFEEAEHLAMSIRYCPGDVPDPPRPAQPPPWVIEERGQRVFRDWCERRIAAVHAEAYLVRWGDFSYLARLKVGDAPVTAFWRVEIEPLTGQVKSYRGALRTSVPERIPRLDMRRERVVDGVGKLLGLVEDRIIGDEAIDPAFRIAADDAALPLLTPDVKASLLALLPADPRLTIGRGLVELSWGAADLTGSSTDLLPDAALTIALEVRGAIERA